MGILRATSDHAGTVVNGITLGEPATDESTPGSFRWEHEKFPNGTISDDGTITVDEGTL